MNKQRRKFSRAAVLLAGASCWWAQGADAQTTPAPAQEGSGDAAAPAAAYGEIIVTAQKRSERLSDVPLSITAQTGEQLAAQGVSTVGDLEKVTPGFAYQQSYYGAPIYSLRGIGFYDTAIAIAPTVSVYVDQVPLPYSVMTSGVGLDVERVEVLKGPQGTLFGQNATGGAINYIAAKPTRDFEFGGRFEYGRFNEANLEGYISGPITEGVSARLAIRSERRDDWQYSQTRPDDTNGSRNFQTGRFLLDLQPTSRLKIELSANGWRDKSDNPAAQYIEFAPILPPPAGLPGVLVIRDNQPIAPDKPRVADWDPGFSFKRDNWFYQLAGRADLELTDDITLTSITSYSKYKAHSPIDADGTQFQNISVTVDANIRSFAQELRLAGTSGPVKWLIGANYGRDVTYDRNSNLAAVTSSYSVGPFVFTQFNYDNAQKVRSKAVFGSLDFAVSDTLTLQASARYNDEKRGFTGCLYDTGNGEIARAFELLSLFVSQQPASIPPGSCITLKANGRADNMRVANRLDQDNLSWRGSVSWKPNADTLLYANVTKGYKSGSFPTIAAIFADQYMPATQESVLAYEAGFKVSLADRRIQLSGAGFYYDYKDKQLLGVKKLLFGNNAALINVPKSRVVGAELAATIRPDQQLTINLGATYVNSKVTESFVTNDPYGAPVDLKGDPFPNTPKWQLTADVSYEFPVSDTLNAYLGANGRYRSSANGAFGNRPQLEIDGYGLIDLRAGFADPGGRWRAGVWARNVTNKFYVVQVTHLIDTTLRTAGMPATYGITASFNF